MGHAFKFRKPNPARLQQKSETKTLNQCFLKALNGSLWDACFSPILNQALSSFQPTEITKHSISLLAVVLK